jgi:hypothetical protein
LSARNLVIGVVSARVGRARFREPSKKRLFWLIRKEELKEMKERLTTLEAIYSEKLKIKE